MEVVHVAPFASPEAADGRGRASEAADCLFSSGGTTEPIRAFGPAVLTPYLLVT